MLMSQRILKKKQNIFLFTALISLIFALFTSRVFIIVLVILILLLISNHLEFYMLIREIFLSRKKPRYINDFINVTFSQDKAHPAKITRHKWFGDDSQSSNHIYSWEDINFTKVIGNTVFDLGNTLLPKGQNIILIQKAIGNTKIIVPEGIAISLNLSFLTGKITIAGAEYALFNENFKWYSDNYQKSSRKVKVTANILLGELEVIFL